MDAKHVVALRSWWGTTISVLTALTWLDNEEVPVSAHWCDDHHLQHCQLMERYSVDARPRASVEAHETTRRHAPAAQRAHAFVAHPCDAAMEP